MEQWTLDAEFLRRVGRDSKTGQPLPVEGAAACVREVQWTRWYRIRFLSFIGWLDVLLHGERPVDAAEAHADAYRRVFTFAPEPMHPEGSLFIPTIAYAGNGHALIWGLAISTDVAHSFGARGLWNRERWTQFLDQVSAGPGPAQARLERFLGRSWSVEPLRQEVASLLASVGTK
jgi:Zn-dependent oligopeptidase